ncbi:MAG TPA: hypothetical protein VM286_00995 [Candidatus Thermoplasmatota archaeon]|nr:hypothetical protein [Candidatus Thermoplasmatota archaeon]
MADAALRWAAALLAFNGLGFGIPGIYGIWSLATGRGVAMFLGFPTYGGGVFERFGIKSTVPLLAMFLLVCVLEVVAAVLLWNGHRSGAILALALLPPGILFWIGFSLPFPPVFATAWTALLLWRWDRLS